MNIKIGKYIVGAGRAFVIAEIGNNHNGSVERAIQMIDLAADMGADCAKFQMRHITEVYRQRALLKDGEDLGTEYVIDLLRRFELSVEDHRQLASHCEKKGIVLRGMPVASMYWRSWRCPLTKWPLQTLPICHYWKNWPVPVSH